MDHRDIADGIRRYRAENSAFTIIFYESILLAVVIGIYLKSIGFFILSMIGLYFLARFRVFAWVVSIGFSVCWGLLGCMLGFMFGFAFGDSAARYLSFIFAIIFFIGFFMSSLRLHLLGYGIR